MKSRERTLRDRGSLLVSFSGLDGSGKTTQINNLTTLLHSGGKAVRTLTFWDDVVVLNRYRESFVHKVYGSEKGIGAPGRPVNRRDKNVRSRYLSFVRHFLYLADAMHLWVVIRKARRSDDVIIMDRYIYDELANLPLSNPVTRAFVQIVKWLVPQPDIAFLLDADPEAARARKPEYPVEFMRECRKSYVQLAELLGYMIIIPPLPLRDALREVECAVVPLLSSSAERREPLRAQPA